MTIRWKNALSVLVALSINSNYLTMDGWKSIQPSNPWLEALEQASSSSLLLRRKSYETIYSTRNQYPHTRLPCWGVLSGCKGIIACLKSLEKSIDSFFVELCTFLTIDDFSKVLDVFLEQIRTELSVISSTYIPCKIKIIIFLNHRSSQAHILNNIENLFSPFNILNLYIYTDICIDFNPICRAVSLTAFNRVRTQKRDPAIARPLCLQVCL